MFNKILFNEAFIQYRVDEVDVRLTGLLMVNSRTPYRELADKLGLSLQAVHRRIQAMQEQGVIRGFPGGLSIAFVNPVVLYLFGTSSYQGLEQAVNELRKDDRTFIVLECARNYLSIGALLRDHSEIDSYVDMARSKARMNDLTIGLMSVTQIGQERVGRADRDRELTSLDYRILNELRPDARRPVEEVAASLNVSAATARRRLARLSEIGAFNAGLDWRPSASPQIVSQIHVRLKEDADKNKVAASLLSKNSSQVISFITFSNLPDFLLLVVWSNTMKELNELTSRTAAEDGVASATPNVIIAEHRFETWIDKMVIHRAAHPKGASSSTH